MLDLGSEVVRGPGSIHTGAHFFTVFFGFHAVTRMHSSRMCTAHLHVVWGEGVGGWSDQVSGGRGRWSDQVSGGGGGGGGG